MVGSGAGALDGTGATGGAGGAARREQAPRSGRATVSNTVASFDRDVGKSALHDLGPEERLEEAKHVFDRTHVLRLELVKLL